MKPIMYFFTAGLLLIAAQVFGQTLVTNLTPATVTSPIGSTVNLQLKVTNFNNINSLQLPIKYNGAVLEFDTIFNSTLPGFVSGNYNVPAPGRIRVTWFPDPFMYPDGFSAPDGSAIFTLRFTVLTNGTTTVNIANDPPVNVEVIANGAPIQVNYQNGGSTVTGGSGGPGPLTGFKIIANTIYIPQGAMGCMPVTVNDFTNIIGLQYAMHWDETVLDFQNTTGYNLPDMTAGSFGGVTDTGTLTLLWSDPAATGVTRANGTKIYDVCFQAIGPVGSKSLITIDSIGFPPGSGGAEAINAASQNVWTSTSGVTDTIFVVTAPPPADAVTFTLDQDTTGAGGQTCVDVTVQNFSSIIAMQYGITYNATQLQFQSIQLGTNPLGMTVGGSFNTSTAGQIVFTWNDPLAMGVSLPDNTVIFSICFTAAAPVGTTAAINFSSLSQPLLPIEIIKEPDGPVNPAMVNGHVYVDSMTIDVVPDVKNACGGNNGSITANVVNGTGSTYQWSGPSGPITGGQTISNLAAGTYNVTVTLAGGGTVAENGIVVESSPAMTIPTPQINISPVQCNGQNNGSISLTVTGGTSPYSFNWDGPGNFDADTKDITGLSPGNYVLNVTDSKGCSITSQPFPVSEPAVLEVKFDSSQNVTCFNSPTGKIFITVTGGTPTYGYSWKNAGGTLVSTAKNPMSLQDGSFNVTVTDSRGCTATMSNPVDITEPPSALIVATPVQKTDVMCWSHNTGEIELNISGGWGGNYQVDWDPQIPGGANPINIPAGTYNGTVTDAGGCELVLAPIEILGPPAIVYINSTPIVVHNLCANDGDGSITIEVDGGNGGPFTYAWNGTTLTGSSIGNLDGGDYVPIVTEVNTGCTAALPAITVNEPAPIDTANAVVVTPTGTMSDGSITLDIVGGTGTLDIKWTGPGGFMSTSDDISGLSAGNYVLTVTDDNDCVFTRTFPLLGPLSFSTTQTPSCGNDGCINLDILGGVPPFQITWNNGPGPVFTSDFEISICTFAQGVYNMTIADNAGNAFTLTGINVPGLDPALVSTNDVNPNGASSNGSITLTPVPDTTTMTYLWEGSGVNGLTTNTVTQLDSGHYQVTVTNVNSGCQSVYEFDLEREWPPMEASSQVTKPTCSYSANGVIVLTVEGGNPVYTYAWTGPNGPISNNSPTLNNVEPGSYSVTVTDLEGTTTTTSTVVTPQSQLTVTNVNVTSNYGGFPVSGADECDGVANVVFNGGVGVTNIMWSNNVTTALNTSLCAGPYTVIVTDAVGCTSSWSSELPSPPAIASAVQVDSISCHGERDGAASVFVSGGIAPYIAKWSTGQTDQIPVSGGLTQALNLPGGDYTITVTDNLGATKVFEVTVPEPAEISIEFASVEPTNFTSCDGELIAQAPGAVAPITYTWSSNLGHSGDSQRAEELCAGEIVTFVLYDANGCAGVGVDTVAFPEDGCLQVRPVLTPGDQDGNNDFLLITCIENGPNSIEIYNRWGQLVFETTNYDNSTNNWKGTSKSGQPLAAGVYYYVLNFTDPVLGLTQRKGHINLLR